jgi:hypothetical protein
MSHVVRLPVWGLSIHEAGYYGYRWGLHIGPWLIFVGSAAKGGGK